MHSLACTANKGFELRANPTAALRNVFPTQRSTDIATVDRLGKHGAASSNWSQKYGAEFDATVVAASLVFNIVSQGYQYAT